MIRDKGRGSRVQSEAPASYRTATSRRGTRTRRRRHAPYGEVETESSRRSTSWRAAVEAHSRLGARAVDEGTEPDAVCVRPDDEGGDGGRGPLGGLRIGRG